MTKRPPLSPKLLPPRPEATTAAPAAALPARSVEPATPRARVAVRLVASFATTVAVLGFAGWTLLSVQGTAVAVRADISRAAWLLPALVALHLGQLLLSALAWRGLLAPHAKRPATVARCAIPSLALFWRLRIVREGIDSLLPVAQVGGEIVGARLLNRLGVAAPRAGASIVVDVTLELLTQVLFLATGLLALTALPHGATADGSVVGEWSPIAWLLPTVGGMAVVLVLAQRFGALRGLERLTGVVARHVPGFADLAGLQAEAEAIYRRGSALCRAAALLWFAWLLGTAETWAVLHALGQDASPQQALVVESLGMAARSAGFALPGAIGVQEGGFVLAATAAGLSGAASAGGVAAVVSVGLALSLLKRLREIAVGLLGLALWRWRWPETSCVGNAIDVR